MLGNFIGVLLHISLVLITIVYILFFIGIIAMEVNYYKTYVKNIINVILEIIIFECISTFIYSVCMGILFILIK